MGQSPSRQRHPSNSAEITPASASVNHSGSTDTPDNNTLSSDPVLNITSHPRASRYTSIRRSILKLVKPTTRSNADCAKISRRYGRRSKRRSKAALDLTQTNELSQVIRSSTESPKRAIGKGKDISTDPDSSSTELPTDIGDHSVATQVPPTDASLDASLDASNATNGVDCKNEKNDTAPSSSRISLQGVPLESLEQDEMGAESTQTSDEPPSQEINMSITEALENAQAPPIVNQEPAMQPTPSHQFPPPGTLVVVQGVVHTTDIPRPSAPFHPDSETLESNTRASPMPPGDGARNRLSTALHSRPASSIVSRPPSMIDTLSTPNNNVSSIFDTTPSSDDHTSETSIQSNTISRTNLPTSDSPNLANEPIPDNSQSGSISPSSIDVLGTLLSVAAAATAASLLTGTSEPILSPNPSPPYNTNGSPLTADPWTSRPTSPTPTAGLGETSSSDPAAIGRAERLRHAWGSIRERLGLRPTPTSTSASPLDNTLYSDMPSALPGNDPREVVLAQMARAFNLGFGLAGEASTQREMRDHERQEDSTSGESSLSATGAESSSQLPPEGSFERFLVDLQTDLRVALTSSDTIPTGSVSTEHTPAPLPGESRASTTNVHAHPDYETSAAADIHEHPPPNPDDVLGSQFGDLHEVEPDNDNIPVHDSQSPQDPLVNGDNNDSATPVHPDQRQARAIEESNSATDVQGQINWWRLYRFPPITAPRASGAVGTAATTSVSPIAFAPSPTPDPDSNSPTVMDPTLPELPSTNPDINARHHQTRTHTVVPVIVVGLQSVNTNWQQQTNVDESEEADMLGDHEEIGRDGPNINDTSFSNNPSRPSGPDGTRRHPRGSHGWHSRAAEALRNLRPNRRPRSTPTTTAPGSRTFLIYVIGGYYPPDHNIVTGGPNSLDSFEALLELAELLGQVKPPTVTKEDIEKSGLEIIRATQLKQYEIDEKISSNCTERCLICLDDYQLEEDIRVMACRHAFHKTCVDKWLETGRNNCPACRSKGVSLSTQDPTEVL